jgi:hypothetical protein
VVFTHNPGMIPQESALNSIASNPETVDVLSSFRRGLLPLQLLVQRRRSVEQCRRPHELQDRVVGSRQFYRFVLYRLLPRSAPPAAPSPFILAQGDDGEESRHATRTPTVLEESSVYSRGSVCLYRLIFGKPKTFTGVSRRIVEVLRFQVFLVGRGLFSAVARRLSELAEPRSGRPSVLVLFQFTPRGLVIHRKTSPLGSAFVQPLPGLLLRGSAERGLSESRRRQRLPAGSCYVSLAAISLVGRKARGQRREPGRMRRRLPPLRIPGEIAYLSRLCPGNQEIAPGFKTVMSRGSSSTRVRLLAGGKSTGGGGIAARHRRGGFGERAGIPTTTTMSFLPPPSTTTAPSTTSIPPAPSGLVACFTLDPANGRVEVNHSLRIDGRCSQGGDGITYRYDLGDGRTRDGSRSSPPPGPIPAPTP